MLEIIRTIGVIIIILLTIHNGQLLERIVVDNNQTRCECSK
jgi:hypothetical protein